MTNPNEFIWVEKYRPKTIDDCILPVALKKLFKDMAAKGEVQNMILAGSAGSGKTTVARALCAEIGADILFINASKDGNIDTLRTSVEGFASTVSLSGSKKVVILDEADYLNPTSTQPALRGVIEEFSKNCRFILTCNFKNRLIDPLWSRTTVIEFVIPKAEKVPLMGAFMKRVLDILQKEGIQADKKVVAELVTKHWPDNRRILNELQRYSASGVIDSGILVNIGEENIRTLYKYLKQKDFSGVRKWVVDNLDNDPILIFRKIYDTMYQYTESSSIPQLVLLIAEYQYKGAFVVDREINLVAFLVEVMASVNFKESPDA